MRQRSLALKLILLFGFCCRPLFSSLAGDTNGELAAEEVVSSALAAHPMLKASAAKWAALKERVPQAKAWPLAELEAIVGGDPVETAAAKTLTEPSKRKQP